MAEDGAFPAKTLGRLGAAGACRAEGQARRGLDWATPEGIRVKPLYTAEDLEGDRDAGVQLRDMMPGFPPYLRGPRATMYANRPWTIRQYSGFSTAEESNRFYRDNLAAGQMGLSIAFDLATHRGYDSDHPRVVGDVGKAGVAINSVEDMKILFDGIPLDRMSVSMTMNGAVLPVLAGYIVAAEEQGVRRRSSRARSRTTSSKSSWSATPISTRPGRRCGSSPTSSNTPPGTCRSSTRSRSPAITWRRPGATSVQELAFTLADGLEYVRAALSRGLAIDEFAPRLSFFFGIGMNFFMEIAKLRAARVLWAQLMRQFAPKNAGEPRLAHALPDLGGEPHRAGPAQQHHPHDIGGIGRGARRHPVVAHQLLRRGAGLADPGLGAGRPQHPADPRRGDRHPACRRSAGRQLLRREPDPLDRRGGDGA